MTLVDEHFQKLKALVLKHAMFYGEVLPDVVIGMHAEALLDLPYEAVAHTYQQVVRTSLAKKMPMPAEIRDLIEPVPNRARDDQDVARDISAKIMTALKRYGWPNLESAKEFLGPLGWEVVDRQGGWQTLCHSTTEEQMPILQAQWRELTLSVMRRARLGKLDERVQIPEPIVKLIPNLVKEIQGK